MDVESEGEGERVPTAGFVVVWLTIVVGCGRDPCSSMMSRTWTRLRDLNTSPHHHRRQLHHIGNFLVILGIGLAYQYIVLDIYFDFGLTVPALSLVLAAGSDH